MTKEQVCQLNIQIFVPEVELTQTLEYIEELMSSTEKGLRHGYLAIYDARDKKKDIDFQGYSFVKEELRKYMQNFSILKVIPLKKTHPA